MRCALLLTGLALFAAPAAAQTDAEIDARITSVFRQCVDESGGVTVAMRDCSSAEYAMQDRRLNQAYRATMARLNQRGRTRLRGLQRAWITARDKQCLEHPDLEGGTLDLIIIDSCFLNATVARTIWLERYRG